MIKSFYTQLSQREKVLILVTGIAMVLAALYFILWQPLINSNERLTRQIDDTSGLSTWIQQQIIVINQLSAQTQANSPKLPSSQGETLFTLVESTLQANEIEPKVGQISSNNPNNVSIQFNSINFDQLITWINALDSNYKISVNQAVINRIDEAPGMVQANLNLVR